MRKPSLFALILPALAAAAHGEDAAAGWRKLPDSFFPGGTGRLRLTEDDRPVELDLESLRWSKDGAAEAYVTRGTRLLFRRDPGAKGKDGSFSAVLLRDVEESPLWVEVDASFPGFEGALPARFQPRGSPDVVFLALGGGGDGIATGFYDPASGRAVDLGDIHPSLRVSLQRSAPCALTVHVEGRLPRGRDVPILAWRSTEVLLPRAAIRRTVVETLAGSLSGFLLPRGGKVVDEARKLTAMTRSGTPAYLELGEPKRSAMTFGPPNRDLMPRAAEGAGPEKPSSLSRDLADLAKAGFHPGLWLVPHGQSDDVEFTRMPRAFVTEKATLAEKPPGNGKDAAKPARPKPVSGGFLGAYVVDGSSAEGLTYLRTLFRALKSEGASIFRLAGLAEALRFYERERKSLADPSKEPIAVLKATVEAMREGVGADAVLAGDWDTPVDLVGLLDAARPTFLEDQGFDPVRWEGLSSATGYFRHRTAWWVECFPLIAWSEGDDEASKRGRDASRVIFPALTGRGQVIEADRKSYPTWAADLLRAAGPPAPVRPIDLFPSEGSPRIWVLKSAGAPDLVGVFNWDALSPQTITIQPWDLGHRGGRGKSLVYFDVTDEAYAGASDGPRDVFLLPGRSRLFAVVEAGDAPRVVGATGRFLASVLDVTTTWDATRKELKGTAKFPALDAGQTEMRVHIACGPALLVRNVQAQGAEAQFGLNEGHLVITLSTAKALEVPFTASFTRGAPPPASPPDPPAALEVAFDGAQRKPLLRWRPSRLGMPWWKKSGEFAVLRDGVEVGRTTDTVFLDSATRGAAHSYAVKAFPGGAECPAVQFTFPTAVDAYLDDWSPEAVVQPRGQPAARRCVTGGALSVAGKRFARGIGTRAPSRLDFQLGGAYERFEASIGVDDAARFQGSVEFVVVVDGAEKLRSGKVRGGAADPRPVSVPITGASMLSLVVEDAEDGPENDLADWGDARVLAR